MHIEEGPSIPDLYNQLWDAFADGYAVDNPIPRVYLHDIYPWFGKYRALRTHLNVIFSRATYDKELQKFLHAVYDLARPIGGHTNTAQHMIWLTDQGVVHAHGDRAERAGYRALDRMIDSLDIIVTAWEAGFAEEKYFRFLADPHHLELFKQLGKFVNAREKMLA